MNRQDASPPRSTLGSMQRHGLSLADVAGLILGMDQGRFEQQMPQVEPAPGRSSS
ncbi:hypothetical protein J3A64_001270 [Pseudarthrobacter sp. PvP004]|uniref:hypothetical protein n=1 Tax=Micrococcaceae TaxID=1268 RepID=UPI0003003440|nr:MULTISPECIES: hypothetical protein [Micrococcaceae]MBP2265806.1 hypothetical protein [Pseudarthrobacter sp. PvP004]